MNVLDNDNVVYMDVDNTLILYDIPEGAHNDDLVTIKNGSASITVYPHPGHIRAIKEFKARGQGVVVWSQGGWRWAKTVISALGLEAYVDVVLRKPVWVFDDLEVGEWMGKRYYEEVK